MSCLIAIVTLEVLLAAWMVYRSNVVLDFRMRLLEEDWDALVCMVLHPRSWPIRVMKNPDTITVLRAERIIRDAAQRT